MQADHAYNNPTPVALGLIPIKHEYRVEIEGKTFHVEGLQVMYIRRNIEPKKGMLALPGGFVNEMETIEEAGVREIKEETGWILSAEDFHLLKSEITPNNRALIFGVTPPQEKSLMETMKANLKKDNAMQREVQGFTIGGCNVEDAAFPLHQKIIGMFLKKENMKMLSKMWKDDSDFWTPERQHEAMAQIKSQGGLSTDPTLC